MGPKKDRGVRKIEIPTDFPPEFEFRDMAADIQQRREERKGGRGIETEGGSQEGGNYTLRIGGSGRKTWKDRQK